MALRQTKVGLIVAADEPALFFSSAAAAEGYLEAEDVREGTYPVAFAPTGERFQVIARGDQVIVVPDPKLPVDEEGLRSLLLSALSSRGSFQNQNSSLDDLLLKCEDYVDDW